MIVFHLESQCFADKNDNKISMVLRCFHNDNTVTFNRFGYYNDGKYIELNDQEINFIIENQVIDKHYIPIECDYYVEDGSRPLKKRDCYKCELSYGCNHHQKYYDKEE
jgi:hypothetical protein